MPAVDLELLAAAAAAMADRASRNDLLRALKLLDRDMRRDWVAFPGPLLTLKQTLTAVTRCYTGSFNTNAPDMCNDSTMSPDAVSVSGAATLLTVSQSTIWRLIRSGKLKSVLIGRNRRIARADLDKLMESRNDA